VSDRIYSFLHYLHEELDSFQDFARKVYLGKAWNPLQSPYTYLHIEDLMFLSFLECLDKAQEYNLDLRLCNKSRGNLNYQNNCTCIRKYNLLLLFPCNYYTKNTRPESRNILYHAKIILDFPTSEEYNSL